MIYKYLPKKLRWYNIPFAIIALIPSIIVHISMKKHHPWFCQYWGWHVTYSDVNLPPWVEVCEHCEKQIYKHY